MEGFLTFLLVFFVFFWIMGKIFPRILVWYIKRKTKNMDASSNIFNGFGAGANNNYEDINNRQEGEVIVTKIEEKEKIIEKQVGEYIDFEEN